MWNVFTGRGRGAEQINVFQIASWDTEVLSICSVQTIWLLQILHDYLRAVLVRDQCKACPGPTCLHTLLLYSSASWSGLWSVKIKPEITQPTLSKQAVCEEKWKLCLLWHQADICSGLAALEEQCRDSIIGSVGFSSSGLVQQLALCRKS